MLKIGITGGIGSGKTTVCKVFELLGIPVFYADDIAKSIMHTDLVLREEIIKNFGKQSYSDKGQLNRKHISGIVFHNPEELEKLNGLVHPAVFRAFDTWIFKHPEAPYILKEAALLYESDSYKMCDLSILVISPIESRIKRVQARDGLSTEEVQSRIDRQLSDEQKIKMANYILMNDEQQLLIPQIISLHHQFLKIALSK